jgi:uncharacterized protein YfaS (alpha-2-macroglobulin family)
MTDVNGMLDIKLSEKPFLMIAKLGKQRGYLKLLDGYTNSLSKFDVEGELVQKGIKGFIYGERGVWRPGDSLYLTFILENKLHKIPENHPVKFELQDVNLFNDNHWEKMNQFFIEYLPKFENAFRPFIKNLK